MKNANKDKKSGLFNIDILSPSVNDVKYIGEITKLNIYSSGYEFEPDGLFSTDIFGNVGSTERNSQFGYINLGVELLHALVYQHVISLNGLYRDIINGEHYAVFNEETKEFVKVESSVKGSSTGLHFFLKHSSKLGLEADKGQSDQRDFKIDMFNRYSSGESLIKHLLVLPAGLRDYIVKDGKPSEDEINDKYRALLSIASNLINLNIDKKDMADYNPIVIKMQKIFLEIYLYFKSILSDKGGFIQGNWTKRPIKYGTRNVITPMTKLVDDLDSENGIGFNDTVVGLYQTVNGISPITKNRLNNIFINKILDPTSNSTFLFNPKTLKAETVTLKAKTHRQWTTFEGLDDILGKLGQDDIRYDGVELDGYYLALVKDTKTGITVYLPNDDVDDVKNLRPITYMELFYITIYKIRNKYPALLTRYPVTGIGSTYLTNIHVRTSVITRTVDLVMSGESFKCYGYPNLNEKPFNSVSPHYSRLGRLGADHDGDTVSLNFLMVNDVLKERDELFNSLKFYISPNNEMTFSIAVDPATLIMEHMTDTLENPEPINLIVYGENHTVNDEVQSIRESILDIKPDLILHEVAWEEKDTFGDIPLLELEPSNTKERKLEGTLKEQFKVREKEMVNTIKKHIDGKKVIVVVVGDTHLRTIETLELGPESPINKLVFDNNGTIIRSKHMEIR